MSRIPPEFKVSIPEDITAQYPANERDMSRLLVYSRDSGEVIHVGIFRDIVEFIAGDLIVLNNTKVIPSRVKGNCQGGGIVELLFLPCKSLPPPYTPPPRRGGGGGGGVCY